MLLTHRTWPEIEAHIEDGGGVILPVGSTEQHGPMGLIGTDAICADLIARRAAERSGTLVAPALAYTPAPFNTSFAGTVSVSEPVFTRFAGEVLGGLRAHGFAGIYILNGHGANLAPLRRAIAALEPARLRLRSWWDFQEVNAIRQELYGEWEGMHATPSEIAITQATIRVVKPGPATEPPEKLPPGYIADHAGDRHGPPDEHRSRFPDGRVGSHSALARPEHGERLLEVAAAAVAEDYRAFLTAG